MTVDHPGPDALTPEDDDFHAAESDHWWTETCWFSFFVPERDLMAYLYCWNRPNIACSGGGVLVWDGSGEAPWELPYFDYQWNLPPAKGDMRDMVWPNGVGVRCVQPLQRYAVQYAKPDRIDIDLDFQGIMDPCLSGAHIDQVGHVTGQMTLNGERSEIDCFAMRDRSWGPRSDLQGMGVRVGYCYGTASPQTGFLLFTDIDDTRDDMQDRYGYVIRDGERCDLVRAVRKVERSAGRPTHIRIEGEDALGRAVEILGDCRNRVAFAPYPGMFCWLSLTRWELFGEVGWGENQDVWPPGSWRAQQESPRR